MSALQWWLQYIDSIAQLSVLGLLFVVVRALWTIRANDLAHIEAAIGRVESKIDDHVKYHLEHDK